MSGNTGLVAAALDNQPLLWVFAVVLYGVGDTVTTLLGLNSDGVTEGGPLALYVLSQGGIPGFLLFKFGFVGGCFAIWYAIGTPGRVAIPLALAVSGTVVTGWNLLVVFS